MSMYNNETFLCLAASVSEVPGLPLTPLHWRRRGAHNGGMQSGVHGATRGGRRRTRIPRQLTDLGGSALALLLISLQLGRLELGLLEPHIAFDGKASHPNCEPRCRPAERQRIQLWSWCCQHRSGGAPHAASPCAGCWRARQLVTQHCTLKLCTADRERERNMAGQTRGGDDRRGEERRGTHPA